MPRTYDPTKRDRQYDAERKRAWRERKRQQMANYKSRTPAPDLERRQVSKSVTWKAMRADPDMVGQLLREYAAEQGVPDDVVPSVDTKRNRDKRGVLVAGGRYVYTWTWYVRPARRLQVAN